VSGRVSLDSALQVPAGVTTRELQGELVLLNLDSGTYFGLDETGTAMWRLIEQHHALRRVFDAMLQEFDVAANTLERDLLTLVQQLVDKGLLVVAAEAQSD
jgi:hypothetical protein